MTKAEQKYEELCKIESDCHLHLPVIQKYVAKGDTVVELGVRFCVSTWALLKNSPRQLVSVDIVRPPVQNLAEVMEAAEEQGTRFEFVQMSSTDVVIQGNVDVLFVDTLHLYSQIVKELWSHSPRTKKYMIFHDANIPEVKACLTDFLYNPEWEIAEWNNDLTGLAVLKRV